MSKPITKDLGTIADISVGGSTPSEKLDENYSFSIAPTVVGTAGLADYTVRCSQDDVTFYDYKPASTAVPIEDALNENDSFPWNYIMIDVAPGGPSSGTAQFNLQLKRV